LEVKGLQEGYLIAATYSRDGFRRFHEELSHLVDVGVFGVAASNSGDIFGGLQEVVAVAEAVVQQAVKEDHYC
jgi:hypothetical protein